jgi:uncharacterized protein YbaA (DUF1428 family)
MSYVDGFIVPVRKRDLAAYRRMAKQAGKVWREHGALEFRESIAGKANLLSAQRQAKERGDRCFLLYRLQIPRRPRPHQRQGHEG